MLGIRNQGRSLIFKILLVFSILFMICCLPRSFTAEVTDEDTKSGFLMFNHHSYEWMDNELYSFSFEKI